MMFAALVLALASTAGARPPSRGQVGAVYLHLQRLKAGKEDRPRSWLGRSPLIHRAVSTLVALPLGKRRRQIASFVRDLERQWREPVSRLEDPALPDPLLLRAEKAAALRRFHRRPRDVTEGFIHAKAGLVAGQPIAARRIFYQRWQPAGRATGTVVVISPGFQETGRNFYEQIDLLTRRGHEVIVMDHQWAGYTCRADAAGTANRGGLDRGFGVARDVAAVAMFASEIASRRHGRRGKVVLVGTSMGAGPGVLGALALTDAGQLELALDGTNEGVRWGAGPRRLRLDNISGVLQSPYLEVSSSLTNKVLAGLGRVPGLRSLAVPVSRLPVVTRDPVAATKFASHAARDGVKTKARTMHDAKPDLQHILRLVEQGHVRRPLYVTHGNADTMTAPSASRALVQTVRSQRGAARLEAIPSRDHIFEENPREQQRILGAVEWVTR